jgi:coenzyme F420-0:L-glutamate ligase/coenzyme F420-1:gamma-L-glutamate ligase
MPEVSAGDALHELVGAAAPDDLRGEDVLVVAQKVVSKAEGRTRRLDEIEASDRARELTDSDAARGKDPRVVQAILDESESILRSGHGVLVCVTYHGFVCANAGVDQSNTSDPGEVILLPEDPDRSARELRAGIAAVRGVAPAVVIADSFGRAWRMGQVDVALGAAGLRPLDDWRGRSDARGRDLSATEIAVADAVAAAADLARGKNSDVPVVLLRGLERFVTVENGPGAAVLRRPVGEDLFR